MPWAAAFPRPSRERWATGRRRDADALVVHAILINGALGLFFSALLLLFGRPLYAAMGGQGASLEAAMLYSNVVFGGTVLVWLMNALASGVVLLVPLSPALIFGFWSNPGHEDRGWWSRRAAD